MSGGLRSRRVSRGPVLAVVALLVGLVLAGVPILGSSPAYAMGSTIATVAGGGFDSSDGVAATAAGMTPSGDAVDAQGNLVVVDRNQAVVRVVAASTGTFYGQSMTPGDIYTIAGNHTSGFSGDGGPATSAELSFPEGVALDATGNVVIADAGNGVVRVVAVATGTFYGVSMTAGDIYRVAGSVHPSSSSSSGDGGPATSATVLPYAVTVDANGNLVIADENPENLSVRVVAATTGTFYGVSMTAGDIYTVAGNGSPFFSGDGGPATSAGIDGPAGVAIDANGNLAIADAGDNAIRVVATSTGTFYGVSMTAGDIYTVAGNTTSGFSGDGGPATSAELSSPAGVTIDANGNLAVSDTNNNVVRVVAAATGSFYGVAMTAGNIYTVGGDATSGFSGDGGPATSAQLSSPQALAVDGPNLIVADTSNGRVREIGTVEAVTPTAGTPQSAGVGATFSTDLQAQVVSPSGDPVVGATVTFSAPSSGASGTFAGGVNTAVTDANGLATAATFTANNTAGSYGVTASVVVTASLAGFPTVGTFALTNDAGPPTSIASTSGDSQSTVVGTTFGTNLQAALTDAFGNPVPGVTVTFTAPASGASGTFAGSENTAVTDANGLATAADFTANGTGGVYSVTASAPGVASPATFSLTNNGGTPASIVVVAGTPQSIPVGTAFPTALQARVTDAQGVPDIGTTVRFSHPTSGAAGTWANSTSSIVNVLTDSNGVASAPVLTANSIPGSYTVTAFVSGLRLPAAQFSLTNTPTTPAAVAASGGTPQSGEVSYAFVHQMQAKVTDSHGHAVLGVTVTFTAPSTGATGSFDGVHDAVATAITDANGVATAPYFTANATPGSYHVTASVNGVSTRASFSLTNLAVSGVTEYVTQNGHDAGHCLTLTAACATIAYAASQAGAPPFSTIKVGPGIFPGPPFTFSNVTIDGSAGTYVTNPNLNETNVFAIANDVTLENLNIISNWDCQQPRLACGFDTGVAAGGPMNLINDTVSGFYYDGVDGDGGVNIINSNINNNGGFNVAIAGNLIDSLVTAGGDGPQGGQGQVGGSGGAWFMGGTSTGSTIHGNNGPGVTGQGNVVGSTITDNGWGYTGSGALAGTILAGNTIPHIGGSDCSSSAMTDGGYNLSQDTSCGFSTARHSLSGVDPKLGALQNNGGPQLTQAPAFTSPVVNKIPPGTIVDGITLCPGTDGRGVARPQPSIGVWCDMGAEELALPVGHNQSYLTTENHAVVKPSGTLFIGATDANPGATSFTSGRNTNPAHGSVTVNSNGSFTYTPNQSFAGTDTFTYVITDNDGFVSKPIQVTVAVAVPGAPTSVTAVSGSTTTTTGTLTVTYTAGAANGSTITAYTATCTSTSSGAASPKTGMHTGATAAPITVSGVTTGKTYTCVVKATNTFGTSAASAPSPPVIVGSPAAPTNVQATKVTSGALKVTFTQGLNNGSALTSTTATCVSSNGGITKSANSTASATSITVTGLTATKIYTCTANETNARGAGLSSTPSPAVTA
jgi:VCBS repeat-containing protein